MTNIVIYIVVVIETFIFVNSFGTKQSFTLLYMLLLAPIIDFLLFKYMKKNLVVMCDDVGENIEKNTEIDYSIIIRNNGLLPIAYLQYELLYNRKLYTEEGRNIRERISVRARDEERDVYSFTTIHRGLATIALTNIKMKSILGLFTANLTTYEKRTNINIIPNLVQVEGLDEFLQSVSLGEAEDDDVSKNSFSGEPSYDFKEYSEGDPLNRVNWKLSSKRNILMIRKRTKM